MPPAMTPMQKRLKTQHAKAAEKGQWQLAAACALALQDESVLDHQVNVVGAIHEMQLLKNVAAPYITEWRDPAPEAWASRCIERLLASDTDFWALAALLGVSVSAVRPALAGLQLHAVRSISSLHGADLVTGVFSPGPVDKVMAKVLELGCDPASQTLVDVARCRAVLFATHQVTNGVLTGKGTATLFMRATSPHGTFRPSDVEFTIDTSDLAPSPNVWSP